MMKFLGSNIQYPAEAKAKGVEGLVVLQFIVETDGSISDVTIVKKLGNGTDEEAARVVKLTSGKWKAGAQNGEPVRVRYTLPVRFALTEEDRASTAHIANKTPIYKGGQEAMLNTMKPYLQLPAEANQENLNARVTVRFYVDAAGKVSNIRVEDTKFKKTIGPGSELDYMDASTFNILNKAILAKLTEAAVEAVKATSGNWQPALKDGQPASSELVLPVQFLGEKAMQQAAATNQAPVMTKYNPIAYNWEDVDVKPQFKDGDFNRFLAKNLRYPAGFDYEGSVKFSITIYKNGKSVGGWYYTGADMPKEEGAFFLEEIKRVAGLMENKWISGKVDGQPVTVTKNITVQYVIDDGSTKQTVEGNEKPDVVVTKHK